MLRKRIAETVLLWRTVGLRRMSAQRVSLRWTLGLKVWRMAAQMLNLWRVRRMWKTVLSLKENCCQGRLWCFVVVGS